MNADIAPSILLIADAMNIIGVVIGVFLTIWYAVCLGLSLRPHAMRRAPWSYLLGLGWLVVLALTVYSYTPYWPHHMLGKSWTAWFMMISLPWWVAFFVLIAATWRQRYHPKNTLLVETEPNILMPLPPVPPSQKL